MTPLYFPKSNYSSFIIMALINIDSILTETKRRLTTMTVGTGITLMSYKRDRTITILAMEGGSFCLQERGFRKTEKIIAPAQLEKHLKKLIKIEFPRSRKVHLHKTNNEGSQPAALSN